MLGFRTKTPSARPTRWRRRALPALLAVASLGAAVPAAQSATTQLHYMCDYPVVGKQPLDLAVSFSPAATIDLGTTMPTAGVAALATDVGAFGELMDALSAKQLSGTSRFRVATALPSASTIQVPVRLSTAPRSYAVGQRRSFLAVGAYPAIKPPKPGTVTYAATTLDMNLTIRDANGAVVNLSAAQRVPATDADPNTFDVPCVLSPATQPATLGTTLVRDPNATPPLRLTFQCTAPIVGAAPFTLTVDAQIPKTLTAGVATGGFAVKTTIVGGGLFSELMGVTMARTIGGAGTLTWKLASPGLTVPIKVPLTVAPVDVPVDNVAPVTLIGTGAMPSLTLRRPGTGSYSVTGLSLNLTARGAAGNVLPLSGFVDPPDSDGNPDTFDMPCALDPASQNTTMATFTIS